MARFFAVLAVVAGALASSANAEETSAGKLTLSSRPTASIWSNPLAANGERPAARWSLGPLQTVQPAANAASGISLASQATGCITKVGHGTLTLAGDTMQSSGTISLSAGLGTMSGSSAGFLQAQRTTTAALAGGISFSGGSGATEFSSAGASKVVVLNDRQVGGTGASNVVVAAGTWQNAYERSDIYVTSTDGRLPVTLPPGGFEGGGELTSVQTISGQQNALPNLSGTMLVTGSGTMAIGSGTMCLRLGDPPAPSATQTFLLTGISLGTSNLNSTYFNTPPSVVLDRGGVLMEFLYIPPPVISRPSIADLASLNGSEPIEMAGTISLRNRADSLTIQPGYSGLVQLGDSTTSSTFENGSIVKRGADTLILAPGYYGSLTILEGTVEMPPSGSFSTIQRGQPQSLGATAVPEPGTLALLAAIGAILAGWSLARRR